jgi:choline dehydrogenase-like flavoprotein
MTVMRALAETFAPGDDGARRAALATERLDRGVDPAQVRRLRLALRAFDSRIANLVLSGRPVRFSGTDQRSRERYLAGWAGSRVAARRDAFHALRGLFTFLAYADPGVDAAHPNPRWAAIGYEPVVNDVAPAPTAISALELPADPAGIARRLPVDLEADVVVVGSGAGGGVIALELARAGRRVLVVEAGPLVTEPDMPTDELAGFGRLFLQQGLSATHDGAIPLFAGSCVGGGTMVNWATCLPAPASIRAEWASRHGLDGFDGAEGDEDFAQLSVELGLRPPPDVPPKDRALLAGATALGIEAAETVRNAAECGDCGSCTFGCRLGAKRSTLRFHLAEAVRLGARILPGVTVDQVTVSAARVTGVQASMARDDGTRRPIRIRAGQVVLAAGALRTPGILERSSVGHSALGRFLRIHPVAGVAAIHPEPVLAWRGTSQAARSIAFAPGSPGVRAPGGFTIEAVPAHPGLLASAIPWSTAAAHAELMARARFIAPYIAITRDTDWGRVTPLRSGGARVQYRLTPGDVDQLRTALVQMARIAAAGGAETVIVPASAVVRWDRADGRASLDGYLDRLRSLDFGPHQAGVFSAHQMGTARMGAQPGLHVCDPRGRVRWSVAGISANQVITGLYVGDSSLFPTAIGVNPMLTVMALARRVTRTVLAEATAG